MKRTASAIWNGGIKNGRGSISTQSRVLSETQYSFATRFESGLGTNPEELIAAAHAGCFSMAVSGQLERAGLMAERIGTTATVTIEQDGPGFTITAVHLDVTARVPGASAETFHAVATQAFPGGHGTARRLTGIGTECASCHKDPHASELGPDCQSCHSTDTFAIKRYTHRRAPVLRSFFTASHITVCSACHKPAPGRTGAPAAVLASYKASTACITCHTDVHRGALGPRCESCHKP